MEKTEQESSEVKLKRKILRIGKGAKNNLKAFAKNASRKSICYLLTTSIEIKKFYTYLGDSLTDCVGFRAFRAKPDKINQTYLPELPY